MLWIMAILQCGTLLYGLWIQATGCSALGLFMFLSRKQVCTEPQSTKKRRCDKKVKDVFVLTLNLRPLLWLHFCCSSDTASPDNHSPAVMSHLTPTMVFSRIFYLTTASLFTLALSLPPLDLSIIVTPTPTSQQLQLLLAPRFWQPIYAVTGLIHLLEVWGVLLRPHEPHDALTVGPAALDCRDSIWTLLTKYSNAGARQEQEISLFLCVLRRHDLW